MVFDELARLVGDAPALADLLVAPLVDFFRDQPEWLPLTGPHPNRGAWLERMNARPSLKSTTWQRLEEMAQTA